MSNERDEKSLPTGQSTVMQDFIEKLLNGTATSPSLIIGEASRNAISRYRDVLARGKKKKVA